MSMEKNGKKIGEILIEKGFITEAQLNDALLDQKVTDKFIGMILKEKGVITDKELMSALAEQFNLPLVDVKTYPADSGLAGKFSTSLIVDHKVFPLKEEEEVITVAIVNPLNAVAINKIEEEAYPLHVKLVLALEEDLNRLIQEYRQQINQRIQNLLKRRPPETGTS